MAATPVTRRLAAGAALAALLGLAGCGWQPLYADHDTAPADADLRAVQVAPIAERIGQRLELALRDRFNPDGIPTPKRYLLNTRLAVTESDLALQSEGLGTEGNVDVAATITLSDLKTHAALLTNQIHTIENFDIEPSGYATIVAREDARKRAEREIEREIVTRLTLFLQRQASTAAAR
jgi:LPS-assembly lipoprotein